MGMPAGQRNYFSAEQKQEIEFLVARFSALPKVQKVRDVVNVDAEIPGCPIEPSIFLTAVDSLVRELKAGAA